MVKIGTEVKQDLPTIVGRSENIADRKKGQLYTNNILWKNT